MSDKLKPILDLHPSDKSAMCNASADALVVRIGWDQKIGNPSQATVQSGEMGAMATPIAQIRLMASGRRPRTARRATEIYTLVSLDVIAGVFCLLATFAPITKHHFVAYGITFGSIFFVTALGLWLLAFHLGRFGLPVASLIGVGETSAIVSLTRTREGAVLVGFVYIWTAIYAASYFSFRSLAIVLGSIAVGSGIALATNGLENWPGVWALLMAPTAGAAFILERSVGRLRREAETDALTGLLNRRGFLKAANLERAVSDRVGLALAIVVLDLDYFKQVNDSEGHAGGDRVLVEATAAWKAQIREGDLLARFGGDEFVMPLADLSDDAAETVLNRCRSAHGISWTAGIAKVRPGADLEDCIRKADEQLYENKLSTSERRLSNEVAAS